MAAGDFAFDFVQTFPHTSSVLTSGERRKPIPWSLRESVVFTLFTTVTAPVSGSRAILPGLPGPAPGSTVTSTQPSLQVRASTSAAYQRAEGPASVQVGCTRGPEKRVASKTRSPATSRTPRAKACFAKASRAASVEPSGPCSDRPGSPPPTSQRSPFTRPAAGPASGGTARRRVESG